MIFSVLTNNWKLEILTTNLVTFKRWDGIKEEKFRYYRGSRKTNILGGLPKKRDLDRFKKAFGEKDGDDTPMHAMLVYNINYEC